MIYLLLSFLFMSFLPGCLSPKQTVPSHKMPEGFEYQHSASNQDLSLSEWWQSFDDVELHTLIVSALENNYDFAVAVERIKAARSFYEVKRAELLPSVDVSSEVSRTKISEVLDQTSFLPRNRVSLFQVGFDGSWEIDIWGKIYREKRARYYDFNAQIEQMNGLKLILIADVARSYVELCEYNQRLLLVVDLISYYDELLCLKQDLFSAGLTSEIELARIEQKRFAVIQEYEQLMLERVQTKNRLAVLLGKNPEEVAFPNRTTVPLLTKEIATGLPSTLLKRRPDIRQKEQELAAAHERIGQAFAEWFPSFSLTGNINSLSSEASLWATGKSIEWSIAPSVRWPLLNFGRVKARIKIRESEKRQVALAYSQIIITALQEVEDFLVAYFQNKKEYDLQHLIVLQAELEKHLIACKYDSGLVSRLFYLEALIAKNEKEAKKVQRAKQLSVSGISLYKALGGEY